MQTITFLGVELDSFLRKQYSFSAEQFHYDQVQDSCASRILTEASEASGILGCGNVAPFDGYEITLELSSCPKMGTGPRHTSRGHQSRVSSHI